ncbi:MAG: DNA cytosine methyltransferase [Thermoguttaceae bacterium]|jgi:DNA (cytosine-5)-methyltransferase 1
MARVPIPTIDLFCGAGGSSWGARLAGAKIVAGFDMCEVAAGAYRENFPEASFYEDRLENLDPFLVAAELGRVDLILASPECTNHSPAKGKGPRCEKSKETAFQVTRFASAFRPRWIVVENVTSMRRWLRYGEFVSTIEDLGYNVTAQVLDTKEFNVPQARQRLFLLCDRARKPSQVKPVTRTFKPASSVVDHNGTFACSPLRSEGRAAPTLQRAERAIAALGKKPFLLVYYGSDGAGGWQRLSRPLRTITTLDRFAFVKWGASGPLMRMLQVPELKAAMGMPQKFSVGHGPRRDRIRLIGNAVCPPIMRAVVRSLIRRA